jgi:DNA-directed RNA polymerase subunit H (RpoH/RPB5)
MNVDRMHKLRRLLVDHQVQWLIVVVDKIPKIHEKELFELSAERMWPRVQIISREILTYPAKCTFSVVNRKEAMHELGVRHFSDLPDVLPDDVAVQLTGALIGDVIEIRGAEYRAFRKVTPEV